MWRLKPGSKIWHHHTRWGQTEPPKYTQKQQYPRQKLFVATVYFKLNELFPVNSHPYTSHTLHTEYSPARIFFYKHTKYICKRTGAPFQHLCEFWVQFLFILYWLNFLYGWKNGRCNLVAEDQHIRHLLRAYVCWRNTMLRRSGLFSFNQIRSNTINKTRNIPRPVLSYST